MDFPVCTEENQIFFPNSAKLNINVRMFLPLKNKRLFWFCFFRVFVTNNPLFIVFILCLFENYKPVETRILHRVLYLKEALSLNTAAKFIRYISKHMRICTNDSFQNLVKIYSSGCMVQHNKILISQVQAILLNE